jgi:hypothetical protein
MKKLMLMSALFVGLPMLAKDVKITVQPNFGSFKDAKGTLTLRVSDKKVASFENKSDKVASAKSSMGTLQNVFKDKTFKMKQGEWLPFKMEYNGYEMNSKIRADTDGTMLIHEFAPGKYTFMSSEIGVQ